MYPHVCAWLRNALFRKYMGAEVTVENTSKKILSRWLYEKNLHRHFKGYECFEIEVDVTGVAIDKERVHIAFVECKLDSITLRDLSQLLGYSKVAQPSLSIILSPRGLSHSLNLLLNVFRRYDILEYGHDRPIIIGRWDCARAEVDLSSIIPLSEIIQFPAKSPISTLLLLLS